MVAGATRSEGLQERNEVDEVQERRDAADLHHGVEEDLQERQGRADRPHAHAQTRDGRLGQQGAARCRDTEQPLRAVVMTCAASASALIEYGPRVSARANSMSTITVVRRRCSGGGAAIGGERI